MRRVQFLISVLCAALMELALPTSTAWASPADDPPSPPRLPAADLVRQVAAGQTVEHLGVEVVGDVDLRSLSSVPRPLRCRECTFTGSFNAADVVFERTLDLSGSTFRGPLLLSGTKVEDAFLLSSSLAGATTRLLGPSDFSLTAFGNVAGFDRAEFSGRTSFVSARFLGPASFDEASFRQPLNFLRAGFIAGASFSGATFGKSANFRSAYFGEYGKFRASTFSATSDFERAVFAGPADFASSTFAAPVTLRQADLRSGGSFTAVRADDLFSFEQVSAAGALDFTGATLQGFANMSNLSSSAGLLLRGAEAYKGLLPNQLSVASLEMDVVDISLVSGAKNQEMVLARIEDSATTRGDLAEANAARYKLLELQGADGGLLDDLYRVAFGYLLRPKYPALALVLIMLLAATLRTAVLLCSAQWQDGNERLGARGALIRSARWHLAGNCCAAWARQLYQAGSRAASRRTEVSLPEPATLRSYLAASATWAEVVAYRVLIAVGLLSLGNSNGTVRQFLSSVGL